MYVLSSREANQTKNKYKKKVSSFANTFGGYIIIGIEEDGNGIASDVKGVNEIPGYKQKITQWCFDNIHPPLSVSVSDPILLSNSIYCYVIHINQSYSAPHFINGRKGCFIRTDEYSQKFTPELATYNEIIHLSESRKGYIEKRNSLLIRASNRFDSHVSVNYDANSDEKKTMNSLLSFSIITSMIYSNIVDESKLKEFISDSRGVEFSYLEVDIYEMVYYAVGISDLYNEDLIINGSKLLGWI